ncbi:UNVERIFIED_CONTAM: hypothetical protein Cloal_1717 [Acetivibrio alkalicellulosi]
MIYGMVPRRRKYFINNNSRNFNNTRNDSDRDKEIEDIPLPNEIDTISNSNDDTNKKSSDNFNQSKRASLKDILSKRFKTDEVILLGLIFLLLEEKTHDDYLLIILIYLLISGMD